MKEAYYSIRLSPTCFALISPMCNKETRTLKLLIKNLRSIVHFFVEILNIFNLIKAFDILFILLVNQMHSL